MTSTLRVAALCSLLTLAACRNEPGEIALTPNSSESVVVMRVLPNAADQYSLIMAPFDPNALQIEDSLAGWVRLASWKNKTPEFEVRTVSPGVYAFDKFEKQSNWALCFHRDTLFFSIRPGQILYLGTFDPNLHLAELQSNVLSRGNTVSPRGAILYHYFDNVSPPRILPPAANGADFVDAKKFVAASMPHVRAELQPVVYSRTRFGTGHNLIGQRLCGGYFKEDIRVQKPQAQ